MSNCIEILGLGTNGPIYRIQNKNKTYVLKFSSFPSPLANIPHHPNITQLIEQSKMSQQWCLIYSDREGVDLEQIQKRNKIKSVGHIIAQICKGLKHLHKNGIIHRDLKPSNIIISTTGEVFIIDCERSKEKEIYTSRIIGHEPYLAPETMEKGEYSTASDIYALGMLINSFLDHIKEKQNQYSDIANICTQKSPKSRPSITQVINALPQEQDDIRLWAQQYIPQLCAQRREYFSSYPLPNNLCLPQSLISPSFSVWPFIILAGLCIVMVFITHHSNEPQKPTQSSSYLLKKTLPPTKTKTKTKTKELIKKSKNESKRDVSKPIITLKSKQKNKEKKRIASSNYRISSIPWGAKVWVDGQYIGTTLIQEIVLTQEEHILTVQFKEKKQRKTLLFDDTHTGYLWNIEENHWKKLHGR